MVSSTLLWVSVYSSNEWLVTLLFFLRTWNLYFIFKCIIFGCTEFRRNGVSSKKPHHRQQIKEKLGKTFSIYYFVCLSFFPFLRFFFDQILLRFSIPPRIFSNQLVYQIFIHFVFICRTVLFSYFLCFFALHPPLGPFPT